MDNLNILNHVAAKLKKQKELRCIGCDKHMGFIKTNTIMSVVLYWCPDCRTLLKKKYK